MKCIYSIAAIVFVQSAFAQVKPLDMAVFSDNANHWYGIKDKHNLINYRDGKPKYEATNYAAIGDNIILFQKDNGGWPKNYDMQAILAPDQIDTLKNAKGETNTTFDNRSTYTQIATLANIYAVTKDAKYKDAALKGFNFIIEAQYGNGGWPQYYPLEKKGYSTHITYNDDAMAGIMFLLRDVKENNELYSFIDDKQRKKIAKAFDKGIDCILKTQINDAGKPTAWCQQHDEFTLEPAWARKFEPPSICNGESVKILQLLMSLKSPSPQVIKAVDDAYTWFNESKIEGIRVDKVDAPVEQSAFRTSKSDRVVVQDPSAKPIWTRYYELKTHKPMFCNRDSKVVYTLAEVERERRDGYAWYTYEPQKVLDKYAKWKASVTVK